MPAPEFDRPSVPVAEGVCLSAIVRDATQDPAVAARSPILLVHGLASNARMWDGVGEELARLGHPSVAVDQRGHGRSDTPDTGYDFETLATDLIAVMDATDLVRPIVAGQSWGANVVLELAARHPARVRGVVCVDGALGALRDAFPDWPSAERALTPPDLVGTLAADLERWIRERHGDWPASGIRGALANFRIRDDGTVEPWLSRARHMAIVRHLWQHDPVALYRRLAAPALLLVADPPERAAQRQQAIDAITASGADVRVSRFRAGDHDLHAQLPEQVAVAIARLDDEFA